MHLSFSLGIRLRRIINTVSEAQHALHLGEVGFAVRTQWSVSQRSPPGHVDSFSWLRFAFWKSLCDTELIDC